MMTLATQVHELVRVLQAVVTALDCFNRPAQCDYTRSMADRLRPLVAELLSAVVSKRSRSDAESALADISELMRDVNEAATKGEMDIFADDTLDRYWHLSTLFRESRFSGQSL
jgi:flagellar biosynthesis/type III secretory pathway protein FliH